MQEEDAIHYQEKISRLEAEISKGIVGQKQVIHQIVLAILADGNVLLEGVPGLGKTQLVKTIAKVMDLSFSRIQFTPDLMPADITGTNLIIKEGDRNCFQFEPGPVFANIVLADEINRATPKTQSALLEAMQEKTVTVGRVTYELPKPYTVLATQNPIENEGTYPLPEAQLDRFLFKLLVSFPDLEELKQIMHLTVGGQQEALETVLTQEELLEIRQVVRDIPVATAVEEYALKLVLGTHPDASEAPERIKKYVMEGASPRAAQAILLTAKARALLDGRYNVSFDDIDDVAPPALRHRIALNFDALSENVSVEDLIRTLQEELDGRKAI
ncbi:MAG: MoxR family ATPase [Lachnospiraceae bacterium]|nr:MoxR family ATPase [Lachnospiraceae bacterium]